eukprot:1159880-Pelagomonas_calceolata.AAC.3
MNKGTSASAAETGCIFLFIGLYARRVQYNFTHKRTRTHTYIVSRCASGTGGWAIQAPPQSYPKKRLLPQPWLPVPPPSQASWLWSSRYDRAASNSGRPRRYAHERKEKKKRVLLYTKLTVRAALNLRQTLPGALKLAVGPLPKKEGSRRLC